MYGIIQKDPSKLKMQTLPLAQETSAATALVTPLQFLAASGDGCNQPVRENISIVLHQCSI